MPNWHPVVKGKVLRPTQIIGAGGPTASEGPQVQSWAYKELGG